MLPGTNHRRVGFISNMRGCLTYAIGVVICRMMTKIACFGFKVKDLCRRTSNSLVHGSGRTNITRRGKLQSECKVMNLLDRRSGGQLNGGRGLRSSKDFDRGDGNKFF